MRGIEKGSKNRGPNGSDIDPELLSPSPILETHRIENEGKKDLPAEVEFGIPQNRYGFESALLEKYPLTKQLLRLMTFITLELLYHTMDLAIPFLAANKWLKNIRVARRGVSTHSYYHREVSLSKLRRLSSHPSR